MKSYLLDLLEKEINPAIMKKFGLKNHLAVPKMEKIILSMGVAANRNFQDNLNDLTLVAGQKSVPTKAKKSIAQFNIREGMNIGAKVTLRKNQMFHFMSRLIFALLNWRSFEGISKKSFNINKNTICLSMGFPDKRMFPEVKSVTSGIRTDGFNITFCIKSKNQEASMFLLEKLGLPFKK